VRICWAEFAIPPFYIEFKIHRRCSAALQIPPNQSLSNPTKIAKKNLPDGRFSNKSQKKQVCSIKPVSLSFPTFSTLLIFAATLKTKTFARTCLFLSISDSVDIYFFHIFLIVNILQNQVELERFELSSKRGINLLSTCLASPEFSCRSKTEATYYNLIPFVSHESRDFIHTISDIAVPPFRIASKPELRVTSRPNTLCKDEALIYYSSIKQRERNCFRQLLFINRD